jgi:hypothetical protein
MSSAVRALLVLTMLACACALRYLPAAAHAIVIVHAVHAVHMPVADGPAGPPWG